MHRISRQLLATTGLAALLTAGVTWAMGPDYQADNFGGGRMLAYLADELDLTVAQEAEIRAIHEGVQEQSDADRQRLDELRESMRAQVENFDPGEAQKIADEIGEITTRVAYTRASTRASVRAVLSDEQLAQLEHLMLEQEDRRERWRDGRRGKRPHLDQE